MVTHLELREFGPDDTAGLTSYADITNRVSAHDAPWEFPRTLHRCEMEGRHGWDGEVPRRFIATVGGEPVGTLGVWTSSYDNLDLAWISGQVLPDRRREGLGTRLHEAAVEVARSMGRTKLGTDGWDLESVRGFAAARGWEERSVSVNRRQHLRELPAGLARDAYDDAAAHAGDYELVRFPGRSPEELLGPLSELTSAINDAPTDDLDIEDEVFTPERVRAYESAQLASDRRLYRVVARHRVTGELAGHSVVAVEAREPTRGEQHDTAVARAHRGHRLGQLLKADMMLWLAESEPQLETVDTWNAESNDHMVAVNERLGYRVLGRALELQQRGPA